MSSGKNKACVYDKPGQLSIKMMDLDIPEPGAGEVLVKVRFSLRRRKSGLTSITSSRTPAYAIGETLQTLLVV